MVIWSDSNSFAFDVNLDNQSMWKILDSDKYPGRRPSGRRCNRCRDKGHIGIRCPKNMTPVCFICGAKDHYEPRCPKKICTQVIHSPVSYFTINALLGIFFFLTMSSKYLENVYSLI